MSDLVADVAVVGAGPVGLALGCALAQHGASVLVLEARPAPAPEARASHVHGRVLELLDGLGVVSLLSGRPTRGARIVSAGRTLVEFRCDGLDTPHPWSLAVPQPEVEAALEQRLLALGGRIRRAARVQQVTPAAEIALEGGERLAARWVAGCDGANSTVRASLGLTLPGRTLAQPWVMADFDTEPDAWLDLAQLHCGPLGLAFRVPLREGERVVVDLPPGEREADASRIAELAQSRVGALPLGRARWASAFRLHRRVAPAWRQGRALLLGDAAHLHSPVGGHGMNTGLLDALHLGWQLAAVLRGAASESLLDRWEAERKAAASDSITQVWWASTLLSWRAAPLGWGRAAALGLLARLPLAQGRMRGWSIALDADATGRWARTFGGAAGAVGTRAPSLGTDLPPGELALVGFDKLAPLWLAERLGERFGRPVAAVRADAARWGSPPAGWLALVRPDGLIAYLGGVAGLGPALDRLLGMGG